MHPLAALLGTWVGEGRGEYPTLTSFVYKERLTFENLGKSFFTYRQRTSRPDGFPLHAEDGFVRVRDGVVELVAAHSTGIVEVSEGRLDVGADGALQFALIARTVAGTSTALQVDALAREFVLAGDALRYTLDMAAAGVSLTRHLEASFTRVG